MEEYVDVVDESHNPIGIAPKKLVHLTGLWHYSIHCWIYRVDPVSQAVSLYFQQRSPSKDLYPGLLDISAAGHYRAGEQPEDGVREISEELGIDVTIGDLVYLGIRTEVAKIGDVVNREFCRVFLLRTSVPASEFVPDGDEVHGLYEISVEDGLNLFRGDRASANGVGVQFVAGAWAESEIEVTTDSMIPRHDPYYRKMFLLARLAASGERDVVI